MGEWVLEGQTVKQKDEARDKAGDKARDRQGYGIRVTENNGPTNSGGAGIQDEARSVDPLLPTGAKAPPTGVLGQGKASNCFRINKTALKMAKSKPNQSHRKPNRRAAELE